MEIKDLLKLDKKGIPYLDSKDVTIEEIAFKRYARPYQRTQYEKEFFKIEGIDDYIIKDTTLYPLFFNHNSNLKLIGKLIEKQELIEEVDFPIAYFKGLFGIRGAVIPYYEDGKSIRELMNIYRFEELKKFYNHESNDIDNLISMFLDILYLLIIMYNKGVCYTDANTGNFVVYKNIMKVLDFEPRDIYFSDKYRRYLKYALSKYASLINIVCWKYFAKKVNFVSGEDFYSTEKKVLELKKVLER